MSETSARADLSPNDSSFKDVPLTAGIVQSLVQELFCGEVVERRRIVENVRREHLARGGRLGSAQSCIEHVKVALSSMCNKGLAQNPAHGYWRICATSQNAAISLESQLTNEDKVVDRTPGFSDETIVQDLGSGSGAVYVYYLPISKELALLRNEQYGACKIGRTDRDPAGRIWTQVATALPERPIIALVYRTDFPLAWERIVHSVLTVRGHRIEGCPGSEWFTTSPEAVLDIMRSLDAVEPSVLCEVKSSGTKS